MVVDSPTSSVLFGKDGIGGAQPDSAIDMSTIPRWHEELRRGREEYAPFRTLDARCSGGRDRRDRGAPLDHDRR